MLENFDDKINGTGTSDGVVITDRVEIMHHNRVGKKIVTMGIFISILATVLSLICLNANTLMGNIKACLLIVKIINVLPDFVYMYLFYVAAIASMVFLFLNSTIFRKTKFDSWIADIACKEISTEFIWYKGKSTIYLNFDRNLNQNNIMDFITNICDKSVKYTYYCEDININSAILTLKVVKREELPIKASVNKDTDKVWNIIPMGDSVNHELRKISPICWWLNDNTKRDDVVKTIPSTSLLISGGTGSGKSVLQNCIIGHISRFPDNFQLILGDVKMVEYGRLNNVQTVKKVALTIEEVSEAVQQARDIMYNRFEFMKNEGVNNVNKIDNEVDYYEVNGKKYQFDEIFNTIINGEQKLLTIDKIYEAVQEGKNVDIDEHYGVM